MHSKNHIILFLFGWIFIFLSVGCSTSRNTWGTRKYHALTTRYNIFFNAEQAYHDILDDQLNTYQEDYSRLLPYYFSPSPHLTATPGGPFDPVIDKMEKAIREHSISSRPRRDPTRPQSPEYRRWLQQNEFNSFIHHAWLLLGKSHVQNGDPHRAITVFNEVIRIFGQTSDVASEARLWMARAHIDGGRLHEAEQTLFAATRSHLPPHLEALSEEVQAYYFIQTGAYREALPFLESAIKTEKRYKQKMRLQFLQGQLYTLLGEKTKAHQAFQNTRTLSTPREIVQHASAYQSSLKNNIDSLAEQLHHSSQLSYTAHVLPDTTSMHPNGKLPIKSKPSRLTNNDDSWTFLRGRTIRNNSFHYGTLSDKSTPADSLLFSDEKGSPHVVLYVPTNQSVLNEKLLYTVSRFNFERYRLRSFHLFFLPLKDAEVLVVRPFESFDEAVRYVREVEVDTLFQADLSREVWPLVISEANLDHLSKGASLPRYLSFLASAYGVRLPIELITDWGDFSEKDSSTTEKTVPLKTQPVIAFEPEELDASRFDKGVIDALSNAPEPEESGKSRFGKSVNDTLRRIPEPMEYSVPHQANTSLLPVTPEALLRRLEEKEAEALRQSMETGTTKSREQLLKERERQRQERIKERERALKEREKEREARLRQRERERQQQIRGRRSH